MMFVWGLLGIVVPLIALLYRSMVYIQLDRWPTLNAKVVGLELPDFLHCEGALFWYKTCEWIWHLPIEIFSVLVAVLLAGLLWILLLVWQKISA
jgi:hypothetical protein